MRPNDILRSALIQAARPLAKQAIDVLTQGKTLGGPAGGTSDQPPTVTNAQEALQTRDLSPQQELDVILIALFQRHKQFFQDWRHRVSWYFRTRLAAAIALTSVCVVGLAAIAVSAAVWTGGSLGLLAGGGGSTVAGIVGILFFKPFAMVEAALTASIGQNALELEYQSRVAECLVPAKADETITLAEAAPCLRKVAAEMLAKIRQAGPSVNTNDLPTPS